MDLVEKQAIIDFVNRLPSLSVEGRSGMSSGITVKEFMHIPGVNDAEYIKKLEELREIDKGIISKAVAKIKKLSEQLSKQQKPTTVTIGRTRGETTMWYECDACGEPVDLKDNYCRNCGRKLIHD